MARLIHNTVSPTVSVKMIIHFEDNTSAEKMVNVGDEVENLRYIDNEELKEANGIVTKIGLLTKKVTGVKLTKPVDYFAKDTELKTVTVDSSEHYASNIIAFPAREIVEDEGVVVPDTEE